MNDILTVNGLNKSYGDFSLKLILDLQELQSNYPKYGLIFPTLLLSVRRLRILCLEISEVRSDVILST